VDAVKKIAEAVLYEGYVLWPYRRSARKNQQRWTFGGVYPRAYSEARGEDDPWIVQTQCLVLGDGEPAVEIKVRFLHVTVGGHLGIGDKHFLIPIEAVERAALELLAGPDRPPAIFCATDDQAIGVLRAARELRIDVPGALAVAGFDNVKEAALTDPPLTTVSSDREALARAAVSLAMGDPSENGPVDRLRRFPVALEIRQSCGCP
jgi:hypothetical protein